MINIPESGRNRAVSGKSAGILLQGFRWSGHDMAEVLDLTRPHLHVLDDAIDQHVAPD
jgi:hypothetical protein